MYNLVANTIKVDAVRKGKKDKEPRAVKKLRELVDELKKKKNMPDGRTLLEDWRLYLKGISYSVN